MFRRSLHYCSLFVLTVLIGAVSAQAQTMRTFRAYEAHIPFDFTVGNNSYQAGDYTIRLRRIFVDNAAFFFTIENAKGEEIRSSVAMRNGNTSKDDTSSIVFDRFGEDRYTYVLKQIVSPEFGYSIRTTKTSTSVNVSKNSMPRPETVAVVLTGRK